MGQAPSKHSDAVSARKSPSAFARVFAVTNRYVSDASGGNVYFDAKPGTKPAARGALSMVQREIDVNLNSNDTTDILITKDDVFNSEPSSVAKRLARLLRRSDSGAVTDGDEEAKGQVGNPASSDRSRRPIRQAPDAGPAAPLVVLVDGGDGTFRDAVRRGARLALGLRTGGPAAQAAWVAASAEGHEQPTFAHHLLVVSMAPADTAARDDGGENQAAAAAVGLAAVLTQLIRTRPPNSVHVIAHAAGCLTLSEALQQMTRNRDCNHNSLGEVVLASAGLPRTALSRRDYDAFRSHVAAPGTPGRSGTVLHYWTPKPTVVFAGVPMPQDGQPLGKTAAYSVLSAAATWAALTAAAHVPPSAKLKWLLPAPFTANWRLPFAVAASVGLISAARAWHHPSRPHEQPGGVDSVETTHTRAGWFGVSVRHSEFVDDNALYDMHVLLRLGRTADQRVTNGTLEQVPRGDGLRISAPVLTQEEAEANRRTRERALVVVVGLGFAAAALAWNRHRAASSFCDKFQRATRQLTSVVAEKDALQRVLATKCGELSTTAKQCADRIAALSAQQRRKLDAAMAATEQQREQASHWLGAIRQVVETARPVIYHRKFADAERVMSALNGLKTVLVWLENQVPP